MTDRISWLPACNATLTKKLAAERKQLLESYALKKGSVRLLVEGTSYYDALNRKIEIAQLNEVIYPYMLFSRATGNDFYSRVVRKTIAELRRRGLVDEASPLLQEGFWDSVQSGIGNFAGGVDSFLKKIKLKKEPKGWEEAQRIFQKIAEKEGHQVVKDLVKAIDSEVKSLESGLGSKPKDSNFPVNKNRNAFFSGVNTIATTYDSIVAATKKDPGDDGYMPVDIANEIIEQLRIVTQKYMADTERDKGGMYASFGGGDAKQEAEAANETEYHEEDVLAEQDDEGAEGAGDKKKEEEEKIDPDAEAEKMMRGQSSQVFNRMTSLKAPLIIAAMGAAMGALGWIAYQPWFHDWVTDFLGIAKTDTETISNSWESTLKDSMDRANPEMTELGQIEAGGGGLAKQVSRLLGLGDSENLLGKDASLEDLKNAALKVGDGDLDKGLRGIAGLTEGRGNPEEAFKWMKGAIEDPQMVGAENISGEGSLWKLWLGGTERSGAPGRQILSKAGKAFADSVTVDKGAGPQMPIDAVRKLEKTKEFWTTMPKGMFSVGVGNKLQGWIIKKAAKAVAKQAAKTVVASATVTTTSSGALGVSTMLASAAPVLAGIGVSAVAAGAALAAIRHRAKTKSRMGTLNSLLQTLNLLAPQPVPDVKPDEGEKSKVTIVLNNPAPAATGGKVKKESLMHALGLLNERTDVTITGLGGNDELKKTGGVAKFSLASVPLDITPSVTDLMSIPFIEKGINDFLPDLNLADPNVEIEIIDKRKAEEIPEKPPQKEAPPVPVVPAEIAKGNNAVVVFDTDGAKVWRILKKKTFQKYAQDAKRSKDKDAPEFADRFSRYDSILAKLRADGVFVNSDVLEAELSKISSGQDGDAYRATYTRTRKDKKTGKEKKRKSTTGGFTSAGEVKSIGDIRKNIKGAPGSRPPRNAGEMTIIYLIGSNTLQALQGAGLDDKKSRQVAMKAISDWASAGKRPSIADLGVDDKAAKVLKKASLAEALGMQQAHRYAIVDVTPKLFKRMIREIRDASNNSGGSISRDRLLTLAGVK